MEIGVKFLNIFIKIVSALNWPTTTLIIFIITIFNLSRISEAFKSSKLIIKKISFKGVELEIDRSQLDQLKENTDKTFSELVKKINTEINRFSTASGIDDCLKRAGDEIWSKIDANNRAKYTECDCRMTLHIPDTIFSNNLYQLCNYFRPSDFGGYFSSENASGRRFSIRHGIIGLATRSRKSQGVAEAFCGTKNDIDELITRWSMLPEQAASAHKRPSCIAIALKDQDSGAIVGILYADSAIKKFFAADDPDSTKFAEECEDLQSVKNLSKHLSEFKRAIATIDLQFNLTDIR